MTDTDIPDHVTREDLLQVIGALWVRLTIARHDEERRREQLDAMATAVGGALGRGDPPAESDRDQTVSLRGLCGLPGKEGGTGQGGRGGAEDPPDADLVVREVG